MLEPWKRRCMQGVAEGRLPVQPGDYVIFTMSGTRLFVLMAMQANNDVNVERNEPVTGQAMSGFFTTAGGEHSLAQIWLDWSGYKELWNVVRIDPKV